MKTQATLAERDARYGRLRAAMAQAGLDALLVAGKGHWWTGRGYLRYLTDFHLWGHDGLLLIPMRGEPALALTSHAVARRIAARGWVEDAAGDVYLVPRTAEAARARELAAARIGVAAELAPRGRHDLLVPPPPRREPGSALGHRHQRGHPDHAGRRRAAERRLGSALAPHVNRADEVRSYR